MELSKQVCSLELSKRLKELGIKQASLFCWYHPSSMASGRKPTEDEWKDDTWLLGSTLHLYEAVGKQGHPRSWFMGCVSAFTVAELGEMLPVGALGAYLNIFKNVEGTWSVGYGKEKTITADIEANACAKVLIYLVENGLCGVGTEGVV